MHAPQSHAVVERYTATARFFHWLTALLVVIAYLASVGGPETRVYSPANDFSRGLHELLGISVFAMTLARVCWRAIFPPPQSPETPAWMELGARFGHWAVYALLVIVPVTAILGASFRATRSRCWPWETFSLGFRSRRRLGLLLADIHGWLGNLLIWLAGLHATAALYHHFWRRDTVLLSMLPGR